MPSIRKPKPANLPIITITIKERKFRDIFGTQNEKCTKYESITIKFPGGGHNVAPDPEGGTKVSVFASTNLRFRLESDLTPNPYYPVGIAFNQTWPSPGPTLDPEADNIERLGLDIYDPVNRIAEPNKPRKHLLVVGCKMWVPGKEYEYHLFIQDGRTGAIGIIDPRIVHEPIIVVPKNSRGRKPSNKNSPSSG